MIYYAPLTDELRELPDRELLVPLSEERRTGPNKSFIPGTNIQHTYDSVSFKLLQGCLRKYQFKMLQGWSPDETPPALAWGRDLHKCLETYHKAVAHGLEHDTAIKRMAKLAALLGERIHSLDTSRTKETLVRSVVWYIDEYKDDPLKTALLPNYQPAVELSFKLPVFDIEVGPTDELPELDFQEVLNYYNKDYEKTITAITQGRRLFGSIYNVPVDCSPRVLRAIEQSFYTITIHFSGHIDRVAHFGSEVFVCDYKTSKYQLTQDWIKGFDMSTQFEGYYTAAHILASQPNTVFPAPPAGVMVEGLQLGVNFTRFARFPLRYSTSTADRFLSDFESLIRIKAEPASRFNLYPRESEAECNHYRRMDGTGGCEFLKVCTKPTSSWERELRQNFVKNIWDPSEVR